MAGLRAELAKDSPKASTIQAAISEVGEALNDGRLAAHSDPQLAAVQADVERALAASRDSVWTAYGAYVFASAWGVRGRLDKAASTLRNCARQAPDEVTFYGERCELLVGCLRELGRPGEAAQHIAAFEMRLETFKRRAADAAVAGQAGADDGARKQLEAVAAARLDAMFYGLRGEHRLHLGLRELAAGDLAKEWDAHEITGDEEALFIALQRQMDLATSGRRGAAALRRIRRYRQRLAAAGAHEILRARRRILLVYEGLAQAQVDGLDPGTEYLEARRLLAEAVRPTPDEPELQVDYLRSAWLKLLDLSLRADDYEAAGRHVRACRALFEAGSKSAEQHRRYAEFVAYQTEWLLTAEASDADLEAQVRRHASAFEAMLREWANTRVRRGGIGFLTESYRRETVGSYLELLEVSGQREGKSAAQIAESLLQPILEIHALSTLARARDVEACSLATLRSDLFEERHGILLIIPTRRHQHGFLIGRDSIRSWRTDEVSDRVAGQAASVLARIEDGSTLGGTEELWSAMLALRDRVLPVELHPSLGKLERLTVSVSGFLSRLPFELLPDVTGDQLLGERMAVDNLDSLSLGPKLASSLAKRPAGQPLRAAWLATLQPPPDLAEELGIPRERMPEAATNAAVAPLGRSMRFEGAEFTCERFFTTSWERFDLVHLVAHGFEDYDVELGNGLALADGSLLPGDPRFDGLRARGVWVVSACGSANSRAREGDGANSTNLGATLIWRGASAVALADTDVPLLDQLELLRHVNSRLTEGDALAPAFAHARNAMRNGGTLHDRCRRARFRVYGAGQRSPAPR